MCVVVKIAFFIFISLGSATFLFAQGQGIRTSQTDRKDEVKNDDVPIGIKENLIKQRIKEEEKEFAKMLRRGEEASKIVDEIVRSFEQTNSLRDTDQKKLQRLEKLVKKIRDDMGGEGDDDDADSRPKSQEEMIADLQENTSTLLAELKKGGRHSISVVAIECSNLVLRYVQWLRSSL